MEKSESIVKLTQAMIKAQTEIKIVEKDATNPFFKSKYADLPAIVKEYQRVFLKNGLVVVQLVEELATGTGLRTTIVHESGEYMSSVAKLNPIKNDPQAAGSAITYMRRYALASICGIVSGDDDDDGQAATHTQTAQAVHTQPIQAKEPIKHEPVNQSVKGDTKSVVGTILEHKEPAGASKFHSYKLSNTDFFISTKKADMIEIMNKHYGAGDTLEVSYTELQNGQYTNRYIAEIAISTPINF